MIVDYKRLNLWGYDVVIRARATTPHLIVDALEDEACFYYVLNGNFTVYTPGGKMEIAKTEGVALQCGNFVGKFFSEGEEYTAEILIFKFPREVLMKIYLEDLPALFARIKEKGQKKKVKINDSALLLRYIEGLLFYIENPDLAMEELLVLKIKELVFILANTDSLEAIQDLIEGLLSPPQVDFNKVVKENTFSDLKLEELAHLCAMSLSTFKRRFKKEFGMSPHRYFTHRKLEKAKSLISHTDLPLNLVAAQCGFKEYSNFSSAFKK